MKLIRDIHIKNFRAIKELKLQTNSINVFVGPNNSGKSSILEALAILTTSHNKYTDSINTNVIKELISSKGYKAKYLFDNADLSEISALISGNLRRVILDYGCDDIKEKDGYLLFQQQYKSNLKNRLVKSLSESFEFDTRGDFRYLNMYENNLFNEYQQLISKMINKSIVQNNLQNFIDNTLNSLIEEFEGIIQKRLDELLNFQKLMIYNKSESGFDSLYALIEEKLIEKTQQFNLSFFFGSTKSDDNPINGNKIYYYPINNIIHKRKMNTVVKFHELPNRNKFVELHDKLVKIGLFDKIISQFKSLLPGYTDLRYTKAEDELYINVEGKDLPLSTQGEGLLSLIYLLFINTIAKDGILIIEEPEISLHPRFMDLSARSLVEDISNKQTFLSTHSTEYIDYLLEHAKDFDVLDKINVVRLHRRQDLEDLEIEIINGEEVVSRLEEIKIDLRGI